MRSSTPLREIRRDNTLEDSSTVYSETLVAHGMSSWIGKVAENRLALDRLQEAVRVGTEKGRLSKNRNILAGLAGCGRIVGEHSNLTQSYLNNLTSNIAECEILREEYRIPAIHTSRISCKSSRNVIEIGTCRQRIMLHSQKS